MKNSYLKIPLTTPEKRKFTSQGSHQIFPDFVISQNFQIQKILNFSNFSKL